MSLRFTTIASVLLLVALAPGRASAQNRGPVAIRPVGDPVRSVDPGDVGTVLFRVVNAGPDTLDTQLELGLPEGWPVLSQPGPALVPPGSSLNRLIAFHVPQRALPEARPVSVALIHASGDTLGTAKVVFRVREHRSVRATVLSGPSVVSTTSPFQIRFAVMNDGNTHETVDLTVSSSLGQPIRLDADRVRLAPFSATEVVADVEPDGLAAGRQPHTVRLLAQAEGENRNVITARAQTRTDMIPEGWDPTDTRPGIPVEVGIIASGDVSDVGRQVALSVPDLPVAGGRMQIGLRGPYMQQTGPFDQQDLYFLNFEKGSTVVGLGDQSFRQTPLTEYGTTGFGGRVSQRIGRLGISAYAMRTRFRFPDRSQVGLSTSYDVLPSLTLRLNGLARREFDDSGLLSLDGEWRLGRRSFVQAELGAGSYAGENGTGMRLQVTHADRQRRLDLRYQNSSAAFPGSARGNRTISATGSHDLGPLVTVDAAYGRTRRAVDFFRSFPTVTGFSRLGGTLRLPQTAGFNMSAMLSANHRYRDDDLLDLTRSETYGAGSISVNRSAATARLTVDQGRTYGAAGSTPFTKSDLTLFVRRGNVNLSSSWVWEQGPRYYYPRSTERNQWSLSADVRWSGSVRMELDLYANWYRDRTMPGSRYAHASLEFDLPYGHRITARARLVQTRFSGRSTTDVFAGFAYSIPVTVPTRVRDTGVFGHVKMASTGKPVQGAVVALGDRIVLTDRSGKFRFGNAVTGQRLTVNPGPEGAGLVVMNPGSLQIGPDSPGRSPVEIALVTGASVEGRIEIARTTASLQTIAADASRHPLAGIVVVADDGTGERLTMTRSDGRFTLEGLPPGTWTLRASPESIPDDVVPMADSVVVHLAAGERLESSLEFRTRTREVRIVGSSALSLASGGIPEPAVARTEETVTESATPADVRANDSVPATLAPTSTRARPGAPAPRAASQPPDSPVAGPSSEDEPVAAATGDLVPAPGPAPYTDVETPSGQEGRTGFPWWLLLFLLLMLAEATRRSRRARSLRRRQLAESIRDWPGPRPPLPGAADRGVTRRQPGDPASRP